MDDGFGAGLGSERDRCARDPCPWPSGPFTAGDARWLFGRERVVSELVGLLSDPGRPGHPVVLTGAAGVGKTSVLAAGLVPAVLEGALPGGGTGVLWRTPGSPVGGGGRPVESCALLVVDRFEELFTARAESERAAYVEELCRLAAGGLPVVIGMRAGCYERCLGFPPLVEALRARSLPLGPMTGAELRRAIIGPARVAGLSLEPGLTETILHDLGARDDAPAAADALPRLSHAMRATWHHRDGDALTRHAYRPTTTAPPPPPADDALSVTARPTEGLLVEASPALEGGGGGEPSGPVPGSPARGGGCPVRRRVRGLVVALVVLVVVAGVGAGLAWQKSGRASDARVTALAERAAAQARALRTTDPALAMQVAVAAQGLADTPGTRGTLLDTAEPYATRLRSTGDRLRAIAYSQDHALLATGADNGVVELWDAADSRRRTPLATLPRTAGPVGALAFRPSGGDRVLLAATRDGVEVWNVVDPARPRHVAALPGASTAAFTPDGRTVLAAAAHGVRRWRLAGRPVPLPPVRTSAQVTRFAVGDDAVVTGHDDGSVRLWDPAAPASPADTIATGLQDAPAALAISPDGSALAWSAPDRGTWLCRLDARRCHRPTRYGDPAGALAFSPDGTVLAAAGDDRTVRLWSLATRAEVTSFPHPDRVLGLAFTADGQALATGSAAGAFYQWRHPVRVPDPVTELALSRDRTLMATTGARGGALWDVRDPRHRVLLSRWNVPRAAGLALSGDARRLATVERGVAVTVWDIRDPYRPARHVRLPVRGLAVAALSPDGRTLATGDHGGRLLLWDVTGPPRRLAARDGFGDVGALDFSPDGGRLASGGADRGVRLWDVRRRALDQVAHHEEHADAVAAVRFGPKGDVLVSTGHDRTARVWRIADLRRVPRPAVLRGHDDTVRIAGFSPDGAALATTDASRTTRVWDLRSRRSIAVLSHPDLGTVLYADDHTLVSAAGHDLRLWDLRPEAVAAVVCEAAGMPLTRAEWRRYFDDLPYRPPCL
ncbi:nSTAND1 domain-containing NTPase [Nonomuraea sp. NPDC001699]